MAGVEVYTPCQVHIDPSNRLATIHQRHRQTDIQDRTTVRKYRANRFTNGRPKANVFISQSIYILQRQNLSERTATAVERNFVCYAYFNQNNNNVTFARWRHFVLQI